MKRLSCDGIFNALLSVQVKELCNSVNIWWMKLRNSVVYFSWTTSSVRGGSNECCSVVFLMTSDFCCQNAKEREFLTFLLCFIRSYYGGW